MSKPFTFNYFGSDIRAVPLGAGSISTPSENQVITAVCLPLTSDNKVIAVDIIGRGIDVPGGHVDQGETSIEAMHRELYEEAMIKVDEPILIDILELTSRDDRLGLKHKPYMLIYAARVQSLDVFVSNNEVSKRHIMTQDEFISSYFADHEYAKEMVSSATQVV